MELPDRGGALAVESISKGFTEVEVGKQYTTPGVSPGDDWEVAWTPGAFSVAEVHGEAGRTARFDWATKTRD